MSNRPKRLTSLQLPRRGAAAVAAGDAADDPYDGPQPQTATCCTALQRGVAQDGLAQPRYAPLRTLRPPAVDDEEEEEDDDDEDDSNSNGKDDGDSAAATTMRSADDGSNGGSGGGVRSANKKKKKMVRKCKSTVDELKVSQLIQGPRLRRSVGMRRDWSFENLGNAA